jgi:hypothetical protein
MKTVRVEQVVIEDGQVSITGLPYKKGQRVEVILVPQSTEPVMYPSLTVQQLRESGLIGLWRDREDIKDSVTYARKLREQAQQRGNLSHDLPGQ